MYAALWRVLPSSIWVKVAILTVAAAVIITALMLFVFPPINSAISVREVTVTP
jgi:F0F1-type ATP synthase membrane subunit b/b'